MDDNGTYLGNIYGIYKECITNISEKIKAETCFADEDLSSWTGLGRSGHVQITTFGPISHVSDPKLSF